METDEQIKKNIAQGLMPCGCEYKKCKCNLSQGDYIIKYKSYLGAMLKGTKLNKSKVLKAAFQQIKDFIKS